jgi:hypothetical protein
MGGRIDGAMPDHLRRAVQTSKRPRSPLAFSARRANSLTVRPRVISGVRVMRRLVLLLGLALSACNRTAPDPAIRFDPAEAAFIRAPGKTEIKGQAFLRDPHGQVNARFAAGEIVRLVPATAYASARFAQFYGAKKYVPAISMMLPREEPESEYAAYTRTTKASSTGRFSFDNVAPGRYFVATQLTFTPKGEWFKQGGAFYDEVTVTGKETDAIEVVLSGN